MEETITRMINSARQPKKYLRTTILLCAFALIVLFPATFDNASATLRLQTADAACGPGVFEDDCSLSDLTAECSNEGQCNPLDLYILNVLASCDRTQSNWEILFGGRVVCSPEEQAAGPQATALLQQYRTANPLSCYEETSLIWSTWTCIWHNLMASVGSLFIAIAAWFLAIAGTLFNWVIEMTVILFSTAMYDLAGDGIELAWAAFRDIANILIIGIFTFIALSIIIGLKEYGQKKLIARVLIIAVLINFSLLFTKMIIDASNFTATQFYTAMMGGRTAADAERDRVNALAAATEEDGTGFATYANSGIAGAFVKLLGLQGISDTHEALVTLADVREDGGLALLYGIFASMLLGAAAFVIFYGSFILFSRALLLIFLLITASVAFASYLIPKWETSRYGWSAWWSSLIKSAVLAPILMLFLWITVNVGGAIQEGNGGSLGSMIGSGGQSIVSDVSALFGYVIVLGLLFISFKLSSSLAGKVGGLSFSTAATMLPISLGSSLIGRVGRNVFGGTASAGLRGMQNRAFGYYDEKNKKWVEGKGTNMFQRLTMSRLDSLKKASFDPLKSRLGKGLTSSLGVSKTFTGSKAGEGGYKGVMERKAKAADELARAIGPDEKQKEEIRRAAMRDRTEQRERHRETLGQQRESNQALLKKLEEIERPQEINKAREKQTERPIAEQRIAAHQEAISRLEEESAAARTRHENELSAIGNDIARSADRAAAKARHTIELNEFTEKLDARRENIATARRDIRVLDTEAIATAEAALKPRVEELTRAIKSSTSALEEYEKQTTQVAQRVGEDAVKNVDVKLRESLLWDPRARSYVEGQIKAHNRRQVWSDFKAAVAPKETVEGTPAAPDAPPTPPAEH